MQKISTLVISFLVISALVTVLVAFYASSATNYPSTVYSDNISGLDQFTPVQNMIGDFGGNDNETMSSQLQNQTPSTGGFNVIGDFLSTGYNALKVAWQSMGIFNTILNTGFSNIPVADALTSQAVHRIQLIIGLIVFVAFIFILIAVLANRGEL